MDFTYLFNQGTAIISQAKEQEAAAKLERERKMVLLSSVGVSIVTSAVVAMSVKKNRLLWSLVGIIAGGTLSYIVGSYMISKQNSTN